MKPTKRKYTKSANWKPILSAKWRLIPLSDILISAQRYQYIMDWARSENLMYHAAKNNGYEFYAKCVDHMKSKANPWNRPYSIYVFEFIDNRAYVGLTCAPESRYCGHTDDIVRGKPNGSPVYLCIKECGMFVYKIIQTGIIGPHRAAFLEKKMIEKYKNGGWSLLNKSKGGELGGAVRLYISDKMLCLDAKKYSSRCEWKINNFSYYEYARRHGLLAKATSHMPKISRKPQSACAKNNIRKALIGHHLSDLTKLKISGAFSQKRRAKLAQ